MSITVNNYFTHDEIKAAISSYYLSVFGMVIKDAQKESVAIRVAKLEFIPKYLRAYLNQSTVSQFQIDKKSTNASNYPPMSLSPETIEAYKRLMDEKYRLIDEKYRVQGRLPVGSQNTLSIPKDIADKMAFHDKAFEDYCSHEFVDYFGFNDSFRYCKKCDQKE